MGREGGARGRTTSAGESLSRRRFGWMLLWPLSRPSEAVAPVIGIWPGKRVVRPALVVPAWL